MTTETTKKTDRQRLNGWFQVRLSKPAESLTLEERSKVREIIAGGVEAARKKLASRVAERPSYATGPTRSEQSAAGELRDAEVLLASYDEWAEEN